MCNVENEKGGFWGYLEGLFGGCHTDIKETNKTPKTSENSPQMKNKSKKPSASYNNA